MTNQKIILNNEVTKFLDELSHPMRNEIEQLRLIILGADGMLTENVKWNGPNYCFDNNDRITMRIQPPKQLQLIFHRGAKVKVQPKGRLIADESGLLTWKENDRAILTMKDMKDIKKSKLALTKIVKAWISATS